MQEWMLVYSFILVNIIYLIVEFNNTDAATLQQSMVPVNILDTPTPLMDFLRFNFFSTFYTPPGYVRDIWLDSKRRGGVLYEMTWPLQSPILNLIEIHLNQSEGCKAVN